MGSEGCERDCTREPARGREMLCRSQLKYRKYKMYEISLFGLFEDEPFALDFLQS